MNVQEHLLTCLAEECAEIAHVCGKSLRFGQDDRSPLDPNGPTNRDRLVDEINDFAAVLHLLEEANIIPRHWWDQQKQSDKKHKVQKFMAYAEERGTLTPNFSP